MVLVGKHQLRVVEAPGSDEAPGPPHLVLECFQPEGSPLQGRCFDVGAKGATLGRRASNAISFSRDVDGVAVGVDSRAVPDRSSARDSEIPQNASRRLGTAQVDSSVSNEHARVFYDARTGRFALADGAGPGRASTNGTWVRMSEAGDRSAPYALLSGDELLVGTIRFQVTTTDTVVERTL